MHATELKEVEESGTFPSSRSHSLAPELQGRETKVKESEHLVTFPGSEWAFWRWACLRSAGFPAKGILKLAGSPELILAADEVATAAQAMEQARQQLLEAVTLGLDQLRARGEWDNKKKRRDLLDAAAAIRKGAIPRPLPETFSPDSVEAFETAARRIETARAAFQDRFAKSRQETSAALHEIAETPGFREALTWQNRGALSSGLDPLLRSLREGASRNSTHRQREELVASYWLRYCVKNDTIGFFGPVGWARITPEVEHLVTTPGKGLVTARKTYWEAWAIEALSEVMERQYGVQPWVPPILMPFLRVEDGRLQHPLFGQVGLSATQAALLTSCDGQATAKQIANRLLQSPDAGFQSENEVYRQLREFAGKGFVFWKFNIPPGPYPERVLREALQRIEEPGIRDSCLRLLDELDKARTEIAASAGDAHRLDRAFENLEQTFTRLTGSAATRNAGLAYGGRTIVYEDCRRNAEVLVNPELLQSVTAPLSVLLTSGRWFTAQVAEAYQEKLVALHSEFVRSTGKSSVDMAAFWTRAVPFFYKDSAALMDPLQEKFRSKWERMLQVDPEAQSVRYSCEELEQRVQQEFSCAQAGWSAALHHSPDIMIASTGDEAIRRGELFFVLGEVHVGVNTLQASLFVNQHPSPQELVDAAESDLGVSNVQPVWPKTREVGSRTSNGLVPDSTFCLEYLPDSFITNRGKALPISALVIENHEGKLLARTRDGKLCLQLIDLMGAHLSRLSVDCFKISGPRRHMPRISIDQLVIQRESWRFSAAELQFAFHADSSERFLEARSWARQHRIPRFAFFKVPIEKKPSYVDFESPILVDMFSKMVRRTAEGEQPEKFVDLSEMLPTPDHVWLRDEDNRKFTSEFRIVAVDMGKQDKTE